MIRPNAKPKMQNRIPKRSSLCPSIPRNETEERSGSFRLASPPTSSLACAANDCAAVNMENVAATAENFAIRHASDRALVSQVRIDTPPVISTKDGGELRVAAKRHTTLSERNSTLLQIREILLR